MSLLEVYLCQSAAVLRWSNRPGCRPDCRVFVFLISSESDSRSSSHLVIAFIVVFVSYAIPGTSLFDQAQSGSAPMPFNSFAPPNGMAFRPRLPTNGPVMRMGGPMTGPMPGSFFPAAAPGMMMHRSRAPMAASRPNIPMMTLGPRGHVQGYGGQSAAYPTRPNHS